MRTHANDVAAANIVKPVLIAINSISVALLAVARLFNMKAISFNEVKR